VKALTKKRLALAISAALSGAAAYAQDPVEEITVTGSRIVRRDLSAPSPIVTVDSEAFANTASVGLEKTLNQLPQFVRPLSLRRFDIRGGATNRPASRRNLLAEPQSR
jgi:hypothetical protein